VGLAETLVVLTSDHGVAPVPEEAVRRKLPAGRVGDSVFGTRIAEALDAAFGPADWVVFDKGASVYLDWNAIREKKLDAAAVEQVAADALAAVPHVWRVFRRSQLLEGRVPDDPWSRCVVRSYHPGRSGDLIVYGEPYWIRSKDGTSHGSPFSYDSHVPLLLSGWGINPGRYDGAVAINDLAPTLATLLRVETPSGSSGRVLVEALSR